jgi:uncharacterized membrane protein
MNLMSLSPSKQKTGRLLFIDFTRGLVIVLMAWDHVSGFWNRYHQGSEGVMGTARPFINTTWFLSRFITHYCAPTFIFLAGTVLAISTVKRSERGESGFNISSRMIIRGVLLLVFEYLVVSLAFETGAYYFGVIACIGVCFMIFSIARKLPPSVIFGASLLIILNHSFLDLSFIPNYTWWGHYLRVIIHEPNFQWPPFTGLYPIIPWVGVMGLGWTFGQLLSGYDTEQIRSLERPLRIIGISALAMFFIVRGMNGYGNLLPRKGASLVDWLYVSKYPPSLAFLLWTLGGMCFMMALGLRLQDRVNFERGIPGAILIFGRTALFFYLTHLWIYRLWFPGTPPLFYLPMTPTIGLWLIGLFVLYHLCSRYDLLKRRYPRSVLQYI